MQPLRACGRGNKDSIFNKAENPLQWQEHATQTPHFTYNTQPCQSPTFDPRHECLLFTLDLFLAVVNMPGLKRTYTLHTTQGILSKSSLHIWMQGSMERSLLGVHLTSKGHDLAQFFIVLHAHLHG